LEDIKNQADKIVMKNNYMNSQIFANHGLLPNAELIYSLWKGYFDKEKAFWDKNKVPVHFIHTSGHAFIDDLKRFADALQPKAIIPIHTEYSTKYAAFFNQLVLPVQDGMAITL